MLTSTEDSAAAVRSGGSRGAVAEQYQALVQWIHSASNVPATAAKSIGVTSCSRGAGVSSVAANLAVAAAQAGAGRVLLLDLSSGSQPELARRLNLSGDCGLPAALSSRDRRAAECAQQTPIDNLWLLAASNTDLGTGVLLENGHVHRLVRELEAEFTFIVVDLPPTDSGLCFAAAGTLNGVLLVMDAAGTRSEAAKRAKQRLIHANAAVLGVILNKQTRDLPTWLDARL
ncbi:MAG: hypothetical protein DWQ37_03545 [Planctomycetota bacterium]|nr:MAG: hypothetical protein DWQ37_03545 [Planctomycetota bacterium]